MFNSKNIFGWIKGHSPRGSFDNRTFHPVREWMIGLAIAFTVIIVGGVQSALMFVQYRNISTTEIGSVAEGAIKYNRNLVELSIEAYRGKKEEYSKYQKETPAEVVAPTVETLVPGEATTSTQTATTSNEEVEDGSILFEEAVIQN
jgi:hypothetical protein